MSFNKKYRSGRVKPIKRVYYRKIDKDNIFLELENLVDWLTQAFKPRLTRPRSDYIKLIRKLEVLRGSRGIVWTTLYIKDARTVLMNYLAGTPLPLITVRSTSDGIPVILGDLIVSVRLGSIPDLRLINTILFATRALNLGKSVDLDSITNAPEMDTPVLDKWVNSFWKELGYRVHDHKTLRALMFKRFHLSTKSGPNGPGNALWASPYDLHNLPQSLREAIYVIGGEPLKNKMETFLSCLTEKSWSKTLQSYLGLFHKNSGYIRRLSSFPDKEMKVRTIAIGDYYSQTALIPLHRYLFRCLRNIRQDCTYNQSAFIEATKDSTYFASIDLTAATDRFPIDQIIAVLGGRLPKSYLQSWKTVMVGFPFYLNDMRDPVYYKTGNPMGFYSSWASFAVAHHYLVFHCCKELGLNWKDLKYCILGDDLVICHRGVADMYKSLISKLGVKFSKQKTYESAHFLEFAKRLFYKGEEISPFPISSLNESTNKYYLFVNLLSELENKGWVTISGAPAAISSYYGMIKGRPSRFKRDIELKSLVVNNVMKITRSTEDISSLFMECAKALGFDMIISNYVALNVLSNIAVESFANSNPASDPVPSIKSRKSIGLGGLAINLVEFLTSDIVGYDLGFTLIESIPHLSVYGQIEESYTNLTRQAREIDTVKQGNWPLILKSMVLPWDDRIFSERSSHTVSRASSVIGKQLKQRLELLKEFYPPDELLRTGPD